MDHSTYFGELSPLPKLLWHPCLVGQFEIGTG